MNTHVISAEDRDSIMEFLKSYSPFIATELEMMRILRGKLEGAVIVPESRLSPSIVSMYSTAKVQELSGREAELYTLVYPRDAKPSQRRLSLLSPLGIALLGSNEGDFFECTIRGTTLKFVIREVLLQPVEA